MLLRDQMNTRRPYGKKVQQHCEKSVAMRLSGVYAKECASLILALIAEFQIVRRAVKQNLSNADPD
jgi:hypothetical protein